jgi:hypothetical protein
VCLRKRALKRNMFWMTSWSFIEIYRRFGGTASHPIRNYILPRFWMTIDEVWIGEWIYWPLIHSYTRLVSTSNYSATANLYNSQITSPAKSFPTSRVFISRSWQRLLTVKFPQLHALKFALHRLPYYQLTTPNLFSLITSRHGPRRKHRFQTENNAQSSAVVMNQLLSRTFRQ